MPVAEGPEFEAWQAIHEPALTVRIWLGHKNGMASIQWAPEVVDAQALVEASQATVLLHETSHTLMKLAAEALAPLELERES